MSSQPATGGLPVARLGRMPSGLPHSAIAWKPWTHLEDGLAETVAYLKGI